METKISLIRRVPAAIADLIISFITPDGDHYEFKCAATGFYEHARPSAAPYVARSRAWETILAVACESGHIEIVRRALRAGARDYGAATVAAAMGTNLSIFVWMLMKHMSMIAPEPDPNPYHHYGYIRSAISCATQMRNFAALRILARVCPPAYYPKILWAHRREIEAKK